MTELPGWYRIGEAGGWLIRYCGLPKPLPDDFKYLGRTVESVSLLEITHTNEISAKSAMQLTLTAGCPTAYGPVAGGEWPPTLVVDGPRS